VWHEPRSNWMRWESTGAHFTLKLANSGMTSVGRARFKSLLAHQYDPRTGRWLDLILLKDTSDLVAAADDLFRDALAWLRADYGRQVFYVERDLVYLVQEVPRAASPV
jgi:hypothetical protein